MENLASLSNFISDSLWQGFIVFLRVSAVVSLLPGFGERTVPIRIKLATAIAFSSIIAPAIDFAPSSTDINMLISLALTETLIGFLIGIGVRFFIMALQTAGAIAAQSTSLSQL